MRDRIPTVAARIIDMMNHRTPPVPLSQEQERVATWLRGNAGAYESLCSLLNARVRDRVSLPISSNPMDSVIYRARDREVCDLVAELSTIYRSPLTTGSEEQDDE